MKNSLTHKEVHDLKIEQNKAWKSFFSDLKTSAGALFSELYTESSLQSMKSNYEFSFMQGAKAYKVIINKEDEQETEQAREDYLDDLQQADTAHLQ